MTQVIHSLCFELNHHVVYINRAILKQNKASFKGYNVFIRPDFQQELSVSVSGHACPLCFWLSSETYWLLSRPACMRLQSLKPHKVIPNSVLQQRIDKKDVIDFIYIYISTHTHTMEYYSAIRKDEILPTICDIIDGT